MYRFLAGCLGGITALALPAIASATSDEDTAVAAFNHYCVDGLLPPQRVVTFLNESHARQLTGSELSRFWVEPSRIWEVETLPRSYIVFLTDRGACGMRVRGLDYQAVISAFKKRNVTKLAGRDEDVLDKVTDFFIQPSSMQRDTETRMIAQFVLGKAGPDTSTVIMSTIPKPLFDKFAPGKITWPSHL